MLLKCSSVPSAEKELHGQITSKQLCAHFLEEMSSYWSETEETIAFTGFLPLMRAGYGDVLIFGRALRAVLGVVPLVRCCDLLCEFSPLLIFLLLFPLPACPHVSLFGVTSVCVRQCLRVWPSEVPDSRVLLSSGLKRSCRTFPTCLLCG